MAQEVASVRFESLRRRRMQRMLFGAGINEKIKAPTTDAERERFDNFKCERDLGDSIILNMPDGWDIHDQGERGACVAHAAVACLEYFHFKHTGQLASFSEQFVQFSMKELQKKLDIVSDRTWLKEAAQVIETSGVCLQSECPYDPFIKPLGLKGAEPSPVASRSAAQNRFTAEVIEHPSSRGTVTSHKIVQTLRSGYPVAISIPVQILRTAAGVTNWTTRLGRFHGIVADPDGDCPDGHAVCLVGYLRDARAAGGGWFVCRNSWGVEWASEAKSGQPFAIPGLPGRGYGVISVRYVDTLCSEIMTITGRVQDSDRFDDAVHDAGTSQAGGRRPPASLPLRAPIVS